MDYSAAEQQQYQQQQQQQQYQHQQYQPEQPQPQSYDPSQYQAYYASYNNQQQYQYYPSYDYATATASSSSSSYHPHQYHPESASIHPPGVPVTHNPTQSQNYENASYYPQHHQSSLSQFPGSFDAAQTSVHPPIGQSAHRGGSRKGGRPFRGGGRRGRGQGGSRYGPPHSGVPNSAPLASVPGQATLTESAQVPAAPRMAWCKICRVDCNTPEILEQHKNGKRHKKNLQTHAELQNLNKVITGQQQNVQLPNPEVQTEVFQPEKVEGSGEKQLTQESVPSQAPTDNDRNETELPNNTVDKVEVNAADSAEDPQRKTRDQFVARGRGLKRKMRGGRGGKYMRTSEGSRKPVEPPKPKEVIPFICELCNVKCESQVVFNSHLVGKKHIANVKRFHGHRALYGEAGLQALYPPNLNASSSSVTPQLQQGVNDPQVLLAQLLTYVLAQAQTPGLLAAQVPGLAAAAAPVLASSQETQYQYYSQTQGPLVISEAENKIVTLEAEGQPESIKSEPEVTASVSIDTNASLPQDNPVIASLEKPDDHAEQDLSAAITLNLSNQGNNPDNAALENKEQDPGSEPEVDPDEDSELEH
ncbi:hypothetical protein LWI29_036858 [Acer saccharum]|uniref:U1-type domain-containing protein n=1 Tax=Acer saccharum TaxID=4024 RepID=A0AA39S6Y4_ACESA|nr:hypothetical protein LWI29_036858 [Acer saccharum]